MHYSQGNGRTCTTSEIYSVISQSQFSERSAIALSSGDRNESTPNHPFMHSTPSFVKYYSTSAVLINANFTSRAHSGLTSVVFMKRTYYIGVYSYFHIILLRPTIIHIINDQSFVVGSYVYSPVNHQQH
jgi:hypothetical protein